MAEESQNVSWAQGTLNDDEWNSAIDAFVAKENEKKGVVSIPAPPHAVRNDEYDFGVNHRVITEDLIRHHVDAVGDPNPLWRDPAYARGTRWGTIIAPPSYISSIAHPNIGARMPEVAGWAEFAAGTRQETFTVIRPGDEFRIIDKYLGMDERPAKDKPYRLFMRSRERKYFNQKDELVATAIGRSIITATPPSKLGKSQSQIYKDIKRHHFSKEELDVIHQAYDEELEGKWRRGAEVLYWEDVQEGEELKPVVKGPLDTADALARAVATGMTHGYAIKWAAMRENLQHYPIDPETGEYRFVRDWHFEDAVAQMMGMPYAFSSGNHNEATLVHVLTNWMGDDGFVRVLDFRNRRINIFGDMNWLKGKVINKYVENDEHLVALEIWAENQDGVKLTTANAVVRLIARADV